MNLREEIDAMLVARVDQDPLLSRLADDPEISGSVEDVIQDLASAFVAHMNLTYAAIRRIADAVDEIDVG